MDSSSFQQYKNICNPTLTETRKKHNAVSHKVREFLEPVSSLAKQRGLTSTQTTGMHGLTFQTVHTTCFL